MTFNKQKKKNQRATAAQMAKYGRNLRKNLIDPAPICKRLQLICDAVFSGNKHEMAHASGICYRQLYRILSGHSRLTIQVAAQIVAKLGVRAEWLLVGSGSMFPIGDSIECYAYLPKILSQYKHFDTLCSALTTAAPAPAPDMLSGLLSRPDDTFSSYANAASAVYRARLVQKPICLFLDEYSVLPDLCYIWRDMFQAGHASMLYTTLSAVYAEISNLGLARPLDLNSFAVLAARMGAGYGETLCRFCASALEEDDTEKITKSSFMTAHARRVPVFCAAEIGEISAHTNPSVRAPELGAAIGAAAYVDLLSFMHTVPSFFGETGGVFICPGDISRLSRLFLSRIQNLSSSPLTINGGVTFIAFADPVDIVGETYAALNSIVALGGNVVLLPRLTEESALTFFSACQRKYAGSNFLIQTGAHDAE